MAKDRNELAISAAGERAFHESHGGEWFFRMVESAANDVAAARDAERFRGSTTTSHVRCSKGEKQQ